MIAPISVCMIVRNESYQLEKCLKSIRPYVAEIIIVDTGSQDNSVEIARKYADKVEIYTKCNLPPTSDGLMLRFEEARNYSFSLATQPWVMWIDGDDEVVGAEHLAELCQEYDTARKGQPSMVTMDYEYGHNHLGQCILTHERERLMAPKEAFNWVGWVHEVCVP